MSSPEIQKRPEEVRRFASGSLENSAHTAMEKPEEVAEALRKNPHKQDILDKISSRMKELSIRDFADVMIMGEAEWITKGASAAYEWAKNTLVGTGEFIWEWTARLVHEWKDSALQYANEKTQGIRDMVNTAGEAIAATAIGVTDMDRSVIMEAVEYWKKKGVEFNKLSPKEQVEHMYSFQTQAALGIIGSKGLWAASKTATLSNEINLGWKVMDKAVSMGAKIGAEAVGLDSGAMKKVETPDIGTISPGSTGIVADNIDHGNSANAENFRDHAFIDTKDMPENMQGSQWYVDRQWQLLIDSEKWKSMSFTERKNFVVHERTHQMMLRLWTERMQTLVNDFTSHPQWKWLQTEGKILMGKNAENATDADIVNELIAHRMGNMRVGEASNMSDTVDSILWKHPEFTTSINQLKEQIAQDPVNEALGLKEAAQNLSPDVHLVDEFWTIPQSPTAIQSYISDIEDIVAKNQKKINNIQSDIDYYKQHGALETDHAITSRKQEMEQLQADNAYLDERLTDAHKAEATKQAGAEKIQTETRQQRDRVDADRAQNQAAQEAAEQSAQEIWEAQKLAERQKLEQASMQHKLHNIEAWLQQVESDLINTQKRLQDIEATSPHDPKVIEAYRKHQLQAKTNEYAQKIQEAQQLLNKIPDDGWARDIRLSNHPVTSADISNLLHDMPNARLFTKQDIWLYINTLENRIKGLLGEVTQLDWRDVNRALTHEKEQLSQKITDLKEQKESLLAQQKALSTERSPN